MTAKKVLAAEEVIVGGDRQDQCLSMEVLDWSFEMATGDGPEGTVLSSLEVIASGIAQIGMPNGDCIVDDGSAHRRLSGGPRNWPPAGASQPIDRVYSLA